jgi:hypothetical protein
VGESRSGEHRRELVERLQAVVSERYGVAGAPSAEVTLSNVREVTEQAAYVVTISNETNSTLTVLTYSLLPGDDPRDPREIAKELAVGEVVTFQLTPPGQCASLLEYMIIAVWDNWDNWYFSPPDYEENGGWTPERVSKEFPGDTDPCSDSWILKW